MFFKGSGRSVCDSGIAVMAGRGRLVSLRAPLVRAERTLLQASGNLTWVRDRDMTPLAMAALSGFQLTFGRIGVLNALLKSRLRKRLICDSSPSGATFTRSIRSGIHQVRVEDTVSGVRDLREVIVSGKSSYAYQPSARYFQRAELDSVPVKIPGEQPGAQGETFTIFRVYDARGDLVETGVKADEAGQQ